MIKIRKIIFLSVIFLIYSHSLFSQEIIEKSDIITNFRIEKDSFPEIHIFLEFTEDAQIPVDLKKEDFKIKELLSNEDIKKEIQPENIQILDTYNIENTKTLDRKGKILSLVLDATLSLKENDFNKLKQYIKDFIQQKHKKDIISLYTINGRSKRIQYFTRSQKRLLSKLEDIKRKGKQTKIYDALYKVLHDLYKYSKNRKEDIGGIVLFTDAKEENSLLEAKDIEELIIFGTKFDIPIYFIITGNIKKYQSLEKISLKTGGEVFIDQFKPELILNKDQIISQDDFFVKKLKISYQSTLNEIKWKYQSNITTEINYNNINLIKFQYNIKNKYLGLLTGFIIFIIIILLSYFIWLYVKQRQKEKLLKQIQEKKEKIDFPEPEIGEVFADLRQYKDEPEKKYIESEEKPEIPLLAQNWIEPSYAPYLDDPLVRKKFSKETMTLSLKEKSYVVLQMALKEAPKYNHAILVKKDKEGLGYDKKYDIFLDEVYIGSSSAAHIPVRDPAVSHIHAKIKRIDNKYILFDLMSVAGTYLNGKKVLRPMPLRHNDEIRMGHTIFRFIGEN
ncbi:MAG: phosphopeptide-binding protein [Leptospiraceae bacterium]|nr:MAG: phosphopeptide-binding protein [Leptospiraceae bacterium]